MHRAWATATAVPSSNLGVGRELSLVDRVGSFVVDRMGHFWGFSRALLFSEFHAINTIFHSSLHLIPRSFISSYNYNWIIIQA